MDLNSPDVQQVAGGAGAGAAAAGTFWAGSAWFCDCPEQPATKTKLDASAMTGLFMAFSPLVVREA